MKFFRKSKDSDHQNNNVLFVCVENAGRSQMAEGFFRKYSPEGYEPLSAGTRPISDINPLAIEAMREVGIDISNQKSKILTEDMIRKSTLRVNMGCVEKESCPTLFIHNVIDWNIEDPKGKSIQKVREIRDVIESRVKELVSNINKTNQPLNT
ncbi:MAG: arsenate reductase ArsC [Candidatus Nitrosopolaris sp.]